jgi:hypothetical protein
VNTEDVEHVTVLLAVHSTPRLACARLFVKLLKWVALLKGKLSVAEGAPVEWIAKAKAEGVYKGRDPSVPADEIRRNAPPGPRSGRDRPGPARVPHERLAGAERGGLSPPAAPFHPAA